MSRIQSDLNTDLPRAIGNAWNVPIGRWAYFFRLSKNRGFEPVLHAFQNGQMQFQQLFHGIEYPAKHVGLGISRELLDVPVRHQIEVEFGPHAL
jgi:hypothetical protein